ncbi:MAG: hypothetical protein FJY10_11405 [Bacteroidetes bacterium]|nr:hypothetical protein [Bacteroidota bacterium]
MKSIVIFLVASLISLAVSAQQTKTGVRNDQKKTDVRNDQKTKADVLNDQQKKSVVPEGQQVKTDVRETDLPSAVKENMASEYPGYKVEKVTRSQTDAATDYEIVVQKNGQKQILVYRENGKKLKSVQMASPGTQPVKQTSPVTPKANPKTSSEKPVKQR